MNIRAHIFLYSEGEATEPAVSQHGFGFFGLGSFSDFPGVSQVGFPPRFSYQLTVLHVPSGIWRSVWVVFVSCVYSFLEKLPSLREKDGASFLFTCIGGISRNQNAIVSEDERQLYTGFNYSMNFRGNYNYYRRLFKNSLNFLIF